MGCRTGCRTKDHRTWGECARAADLQIDRYSLLIVGENGGARSPQAMEKAKNESLERYRQMRKSGLEPMSPLKKDLDACEAALTDKKPKILTNDKV